MQEIWFEQLSFKVTPLCSIQDPDGRFYFFVAVTKIAPEHIHLVLDDRGHLVCQIVFDVLAETRIVQIDSTDFIRDAIRRMQVDLRRRYRVDETYRMGDGFILVHRLLRSRSTRDHGTE